MRKILLVCLCLLLVGCQDSEPSDNSELTNNKISLKYTEMKNKLIEYGKLVYENEQWLNEDAKEVTSAMTLRDLSEKNGYDISMFKNPVTSEQCDLEKTKIEFKITDVTDLNDIKYEFNPVLVCGNDDLDSTNEFVDNKYKDLYDKLIKYTEDYYDIKNIDDKNLSVGEYKLTLMELKDNNYDISMFKNPNTGKQCDLEKSYALLNVSDVNGKKDYRFNYYFNCE